MGVHSPDGGHRRALIVRRSQGRPLRGPRRGITPFVPIKPPPKEAPVGLEYRDAGSERKNRRSAVACCYEPLGIPQGFGEAVVAER
jgi:hypothetical protein